MIDELKIEEGSSTGDNLKASVDYQGLISIEVEEPWAGDTEAGFGRSGAIRLTREKALLLACWLQEAAEEMTPSPSMRNR